MSVSVSFIMLFFISGDQLCYNCGKRYSSRISLYKHRRHCGITPNYVCAVEGCTYKTNLKQNLKRHVVHKHKYLYKKGVEISSTAATFQ